jgi:hypothetical protein
MVNRRRQEEAVLTIKPLLVGCIAPGLAMACNKMSGIIDAGDALAILLALTLYERGWRSRMRLARSRTGNMPVQVDTPWGGRLRRDAGRIFLKNALYIQHPIVIRAYYE